MSYNIFNYNNKDDIFYIFVVKYMFNIKINTMRKKTFLTLLVAFCMFSCTNQLLDGDLNKSDSNEEPIASSKLSTQQAKAYASMFSSYLDENDSPDAKSRSVLNKEKELDNIDYLIENGDTLLYSFNYKNNEGFIIIAGDNSSFPIVAHSKEGNLRFSTLDKDNPLNLFVSSYKNRVKKDIKDSDIYDNEYYENWKDLGHEGYEYEIIPTNNEPVFVESRGRRENSTGKASIYPYTGKDLNYWCQEGGYNYYANSGTPIGCPAIAIGMLLYDTSERILGNSTSTYPSFGYYDMYDIKSTTGPTDTALKLRQIADNIPSYSYTVNGSGASPQNVLAGLKRLGYKNAQLVSYNFETLYNNLSFKGYNYFGEETTFNRGVLIAAYQNQYGGGHIWFCDGYYEQSYTVTKKFMGIKIKSWKEYDDRLYMNWGWGANGGNGWYCATDDIWTSLEGNSNINLKYNAKMYINLGNYENPQYY